MKRMVHLKHLLPVLLCTANLFLSFISNAQVTQEWLRRVKGPSNGYANAGNMAIDNSGNIYISGVISGLFSDFVTIKYNSKGDQLWSTGINGLDSTANLPTKMVLSKNGNIYETGVTYDIPKEAGGSEQGRFITVKYDTSGAQKWVRTFSSEQANIFSDEEARSLAIDDSDNVYVTGYGVGPDGTWDFYTIKYNANGIEQWVQSYHYFDNGDDYPSAIAVDSKGNSYVIGLSIGSQFFFSFIKYNTNGDKLWVKQLDIGVGNSTREIIVDDSDNIYITGGGTVKYDTDGNIIWKYDGNQGFGAALSLDKSGNVYVAGIRFGSNLDYDFMTTKYNSSGTPQWKQYYGGPENYKDGAVDIGIDSAGNSYVTGWSYNRQELSDFVIIKYNTNGQQQWIERYDGPDNKNDNPSSLILDQSANVYVTGISQNEIATIKYHQGSAQNGVCCFTGPNGQQAVCGPRVNAVNCQSSGENAFFVGTVTDCSVIDTSGICSVRASSVILAAKYNETDNTVLLSWNLNNNEYKTTGYYIQRSKDGYSFKTIGFMPVNTTGNYSFTDNYPLLEGYYKLVWFERQGYESNKVLAVAISSTKMELIPIPALDKIRILIRDMQKYETKVSIYDNTGRLVFTQKLNKGQSPEINISRLASGTYYLRAEMNGKVYNEKVLKK